VPRVGKTQDATKPAGEEKILPTLFGASGRKKTWPRRERGRMFPYGDERARGLAKLGGKNWSEKKKKAHRGTEGEETREEHLERNLFQIHSSNSPFTYELWGR